MENLNFHKQKLYALIIAGVGLIAMFLPWWRISYGGYGGFGGISASVNGMHELGLLAFAGFAAAGVVAFMGDKTRPFEGQMKMYAAAAFGAAALIALIQFLRQSKFTSFGLYLALLAGIAGLVLVYFIKPEQLGASTKPPAPPTPKV
jgi:hypothetical protein